MIKKLNIHLVILFLIIILGFAVRVYKLSDIPHGFFADEASIGYNAYTILTKGTDEYGTQFPVFFRAFGEYKSPVQIYSTVPFIDIFGLNEFSVRLPSVVFGTLAIIAIFLLTKELFKQNKHSKFIGLIASFFLSISPWDIHFSRVSLEGLTAFVFFTTIGLYFFLKIQKNKKFLLISIIFFTFAIYSYFPARIFIPLYCMSIVILYIKFFLKKIHFILLNSLLLLILLFPLISFTLSPVGFSRWNQVNIFSQPPVNESVSAHIAHILNNYLSHFSMDFLFLKGDIGMPGQFITRHSVTGMGELYLFQLPLILLGLYLLFKTEYKKIFALLVAWIIFYPTGSMFTIDKSVQATRSIIGVIPLQILSAFGLITTIIWIMDYCKKNKQLKHIFYFSLFLFFIIILYSFTFFLNIYFTKYPLYSSDYWGWQFGYKDSMAYFYKHKKNFDDLLITHRFNAGEELLKFYNVIYPCNKCHVMTNPISIDSNRIQLFAIKIDDINEAKKIYPNTHFVTDKIIYLPNGNKEIYIGEFK